MRATLGPGDRSPGYDEVETAGAAPLPMPGLYLHGRNDGCLDVETVDDSVRSSFPDRASRIDLVDGVGHFLQRKDPDRTNRSILNFFAEP